ncbi:MAG: hypothetical protein GF346_05525, partial [Candidatus Eisenbacteria bacterium]|nr:hypothetical protein [Candidatus Latescibacterota bacterium]MBD3301888.1 hypothetical protein [Candidatus Eisenbacteria bacterium]
MRTLTRILACSLLLAAVAAGSSPAQWSGVEADQVVSHDDDEYARAVQVLLSGYGDRVHAFWSEDAPSDREIHYGAAGSFADDWTSLDADRVISFPDGNEVWPEECDVASSGLDEPVLVVVWSEDETANREVHYGVSTDLGETWSSETADRMLSDPSTAADTNVPSITADGDGVFHVVWHQGTEGGGPAEVHYSRSTDGGATWSGQTGDRIISFPDGNPAIEPAIAYGDLGILYV